MLIDSHCHLNFPQFYNNIDHYLSLMAQANVTYALCVGTRPDNLDIVVDLAQKHANLFAAVGVHPDEQIDNFIITPEWLINYAAHDKVIAIGETGLDYLNVSSSDIIIQQQRFRLHIDVATQVNLPLIIHTRNSITDTLSILRESNAMQCGAVMHCFTETLDYAKQCLDLGFYISLSGIVTFKNAHIVQDVARYIPLDRLLIETDAPFLAPVPMRGKENHPALIIHTAQFIAQLKQIPWETVANATSTNFWTLFHKAQPVL